MNYEQIAKESRLKVLELVYKAQTSHIGSLFSCADIMAVLLEKIDWDKDKFILSAGWKVAMLYYHLWRQGKITEEELNSYCIGDSKFIGLAEPIIPEIPFAGGSMGYGFPAAVGFALAKKLKGEEGKVYCLMSDGELAIGTTWEAALIANHHKLDNLVVIVDCNGFQAMGKTEDILTLGDLKIKWREFGFGDIEVDGHDLNKLQDIIRFVSHDNKNIFYSSLTKKAREALFSPKIILAKTIKGKGVSFMENNNLYHYKQLTKDEYDRASEELRQA